MSCFLGLYPNNTTMQKDYPGAIIVVTLKMFDRIRPTSLLGKANSHNEHDKNTTK